MNGLISYGIMRLYDHSMHINYFRMLPSTFDDLLRLIGPTLVKRKSWFREPLPPALRLAVALRYLAIGESQTSLSYNYRVGKSTVCQILIEVPEKIWEILSPIAVKVPEREDDWKKLAKDFWNLWGFPHCLGAIDGKHCVINCPQNSGSAFYNYKGSFSIVLMAVADASYMFTYVDVGDYGRQCDSAVFNNSTFGKALNNDILNIPHSDFLPSTTANARYCFVGDEAFPLKENLQRPYPGKCYLRNEESTTTDSPEQEELWKIHSESCLQGGDFCEGLLKLSQRKLGNIYLLR